MCMFSDPSVRQWYAEVGRFKGRKRAWEHIESGSEALAQCVLLGT